MYIHESDSVGFFFFLGNIVPRTLSLKGVTLDYLKTQAFEFIPSYHGFVEPLSQKLVKQ